MVRGAIRFIKRTLGIGKERYFVGNDLQGNSYYEKPAEDFFIEKTLTERTRTRRFVDFYKQLEDLSSFRDRKIPPQWSSWLSFTRKNPPTIQELQLDQLRLERLKENVERLELIENERKASSSKLNQPSLLEDRSQSKDHSESNGVLQLKVDKSVEQGLQREYEIELERKRNEMKKSPLMAFDLNDPQKLQKGQENKNLGSSSSGNGQPSFDNPKTSRGSFNQNSDWQPESWNPQPFKRDNQKS